MTRTPDSYRWKPTGKQRRERLEAWIDQPDGTRAWGLLWRCNRCLRLLPEAAYTIVTAKNGTRRPHVFCRRCNAERVKAFWREHPDKLTESRQRFEERRRHNPDVRARYLESKRRHYRANREAILAQKRTYRRHRIWKAVVTRLNTKRKE